MGKLTKKMLDDFASSMDRVSAQGAASYMIVSPEIAHYFEDLNKQEDRRKKLKKIKRNIKQNNKPLIYNTKINKKYHD